MNSIKRRKLSIDIDETSGQAFDVIHEMSTNSVVKTSPSSDSHLSFASCVGSELNLEESLESSELSFHSLTTDTTHPIVAIDEELSLSNDSNQTGESFPKTGLESNSEESVGCGEKRFNDFLNLLNKSKRYSEVLEQNHESIGTDSLSEQSFRKEFEYNKKNNKWSNGSTARQVLSESNQKSDDSLSVSTNGSKRSLRNRIVFDEDLSDDSINSYADSALSITSVKLNFRTNRTLRGLPVDWRQPVLISGAIMRDYQLEGFDWLRRLHSNNINGILADEMGLGKTIQAIAMIAHLIESNESEPFLGPFLVIAPLSTLHNWKQEFERFAPLIPTLLFHGSAKERLKLYKLFTNVATIDGFGFCRKCLPVIITSYEMFKRSVGTMKKYDWMYVVVDEGHKIKNISCQISRTMRQIRSRNRLILTGTPLHNNLAELWALLNYVSPDIFNDFQIFEDLLASDSSNEFIIQQEMEKKIISSMHQILSPFMMRRTKTDCGLDLPPKKEILVYTPSTPTQQQLYEFAVNLVRFAKANKDSAYKVKVDVNEGRKLRKSSQNVDYKQYYQDFDEWLDSESNSSAGSLQLQLPAELMSGEKSEEYVSFGRFNRYNIMMQMRKITNHPFLVRWPCDPRTQEVVVNRDIIRVSGKMRALDQLLQQLYVRKHRVLLFSQMTKMLDIIEEYCNYKNYRFVRFDGTTNLEKRQQYIDEFNSNDSIFLFLLSTRAGGLGINLMGADTAIIYDSDWNPQMDLQAQDRCHRIGQTKPVLIYRFVTSHTIDEKMLRTANRKRKLDKMIIQKGQYFRSLKEEQIDNQNRKISLDELLNILESTDFKAIYNYSSDKLGSKRLYSDEDMKKMLDRSGCSDANEQNLIEIGRQFNQIDV